MINIKKVFEYSGLLAFLLFSFYYTDKVVGLAQKRDPIMESIIEQVSLVNKGCIEGYISEEGVVPGISGKSIDVDKSYQNMKGLGFNKELLVYNEEKCIVSSVNNMKNYIIKGNEKKNSVSILLLINNNEYLKDIINIATNKKIKIDLIINERLLEENREMYTKLINNGFNFIYNDNKNINKYLKYLKDEDKENTSLCIKTKNIDPIEECKNKKINTIVPKTYLSKNILLSLKNTLYKGQFIVLYENKNTVNELSAVINFINAKGIDIKNVRNHIS
ncbi:MAG: hypothetical protein RSB41_02250 [Bacilli bacterium]